MKSENGCGHGFIIKADTKRREYCELLRQTLLPQNRLQYYMKLHFRSWFVYFNLISSHAHGILQSVDTMYKSDIAIIAPYRVDIAVPLG